MIAARIALGLICLGLTAVSAQEIGMVVDKSGTVTVFDAVSNSIVGSVVFNPDANLAGDCAMTADGTLGFVTDADRQIWVIDLVDLKLANGTNPIPIGNSGLDVVISPDGRHVIVCNGGSSQPLFVVDIAARRQVFGLSTGTTSAVDVCMDGSVLAVTLLRRYVQRFTIDVTGRMKDTGEMLGDLGSPMNVYCAPGGRVGIVTNRHFPPVQSFSIHGLEHLDQLEALVGTIMVAAFSPTGDRLYVRTNGNASVIAYEFDPQTGQIGGQLFRTFITLMNPIFGGIEVMQITPDGSKIYVSQPEAVKIIDAINGDLIGSLTDSTIVDPRGICFRSSRRPVVIGSLDIMPGACPNPLNARVFRGDHPGNNDNPKKGGVFRVALLGAEGFDVRDLDLSTVKLAGVPPLRSAFADIASPVSGAQDPCDCPDPGPDGQMDLTMKFQKSDIVSALRADRLPDGSNVPVVFTARRQDGMFVEATDCVKVLSDIKPEDGGGDSPLTDSRKPDQKLKLLSASPNPFNPTTTIRYELPSDGFVRLAVFDVAGRLVEQLILEWQIAGRHAVTWKADHVPSGVYYARIQAGRYIDVHKIILLK